MGGASGGSHSSSDITRLEEKAKQNLTQAKVRASRHVFISFDHDDLDEVNLLRGQAKNDEFDLEFDDYSVKEPFDSANADYIKRQIREKIDRCSVTVVYLSEKAASSKWVDWEVAESIRLCKGVIGVYKGEKAPANVPPTFRQNGCQSVRWEHAALMSAIENASARR